MNAVNYTTARKELARMMENVCQDCDPVIITKNNDCAVVMISLADYQSLAETDYLLRNPANAERLQRSIKASRRGSGQRMSMEQFEELCDAQSSVDA